jgi:putative tRNA adenosine deaminase-associated protein
VVSYFTAVIAHAGSAWRAKDVEVDEAGSMDDLVDGLRSVTSDGPVLVVVEHEDEWFALIRVDGDDDPRIFVSNAATALRGPYAELLSSAGEMGLDGVDDQGDAELGRTFENFVDEEAPVAQEDLDTDLDDDRPGGPVWGGDPEIVEDLGMSSQRLRDLVEKNSDDPGAVLGEVGDVAGFSELLEALR